MELNQDFKEFIELLNKHNVKYLVVGGYAVGFHGYPRFTGDIDFWIAISNENASKIVTVLNEFGFGSLDFKVADFLDDNSVIQLGYEPTRIDILTSLSGVQFDECYNQSVIADFEGLKINFIDLKNLRTNKASTGRAKDLGDLENLVD
jgi:hypothetical protein